VATATHLLTEKEATAHPPQEAVVVRFAGDSGDGMQLTGGQFTLSTALAGNDLATFPDFPAEIRAPQGTTFGVSAFQINFGSCAIDTAGDTDHCVYARNHIQEVNGKCIDLDGFHHGEVSGNSCVNRFGADHYPFGNQGIVLNNSDPSMQSEQIEIAGNELDGVLFSGIFVIGRQHRITRNRLRRINLAHCDQNVTRYGCNYAPEQPGLLRRAGSGPCRI